MIIDRYPVAYKLPLDDRLRDPFFLNANLFLGSPFS